LFVLPLTHLRLNVTRKAEVGGDGDNKDARVVGKSLKKKNFSAFRSTLHRCSPLLIHAAPIMHRKKALDAQEPCHAVLDGSQRNAQASWEGQRHGGARPERPVFFFFLGLVGRKIATMSVIVRRGWLEKRGETMGFYHARYVHLTDAAFVVFGDEKVRTFFVGAPRPFLPLPPCTPCYFGIVKSTGCYLGIQFN
jgi:hypothetical protein